MSAPIINQKIKAMPANIVMVEMIAETISLNRAAGSIIFEVSVKPLVKPVSWIINYKASGIIILGWAESIGVAPGILGLIIAPASP